MIGKDFIKKCGLEKAKVIAKEAPMYPCVAFDTATNNYIFKQCESTPCSFSTEDNAWSEEYAIEPIYLDELERLIEAHDLVTSYGGIDKAHEFALSVWRSNKSDPFIVKMKKAIADVESCL